MPLGFNGTVGFGPPKSMSFGGRIATQIAEMVEMRLFWLVTSSVLRANLLNSKCSCWLNIQIYDEVLNFPSFLLVNIREQDLWLKTAIALG